MSNPIAFIYQNMKWFIIAGILIGGGILAFVVYSIYKASQEKQNKPLNIHKPSPVAPSDGYCTDEMCFAVHSDEHKESFSASSNEKQSDEHDESEPIESYSSIEEHDDNSDE